MVETCINAESDVLTRSANLSVGTRLPEDKTTKTENLATQTSTSLETVATQTDGKDDFVTTLRSPGGEQTSTITGRNEMTRTYRKTVETETDANSDLVTCLENLDIGKRSLEDKTTKTEDLATQTSTSLETVATQTDGKHNLVTTFGNPDGGLSISKSIQRVIGPRGDGLDVGCCFVAFPPDSFSKSTPVIVRAELDTSKRRKKFILFTPSLYIDTIGLLGKVRVRLPSWYVKHQQTAKAHLLHLPEDADDWEDTGVSLPVTSEPFFEFEWQNFSGVAVGVPASSSTHEVLNFLTSINLYVSDANELSVAFLVNCKGGRVSDSLALEEVNNRMASATPPKNWKLEQDLSTAKYGDTIKICIKCDDPRELTFKPKDGFKFKLDEDFNDRLFVERHGVISGSLEKMQMVEMKSKVYKKSGKREETIREDWFTCNWMPRSVAAEVKRKRARSSGDINIKVDKRRQRHKRVTAQNYASHGATLHSSQTGCNVRMNVESSSEEMEQSEDSD